MITIPIALEIIAQADKETAEKSEVAWYVILGAIGTIISIMVALVTLGRYLHKWDKDRIVKQAADMKRMEDKLDTGNGLTIGQTAKTVHDNVRRIEQQTSINATRIEALDARLDAQDARLTRHEYIGHPQQPPTS